MNKIIVPKIYDQLNFEAFSDLRTKYNLLTVDNIITDKPKRLKFGLSEV